MKILDYVWFYLSLHLTDYHYEFSQKKWDNISGYQRRLYFYRFVPAQTHNSLKFLCAFWELITVSKAVFDSFTLAGSTNSAAKSNKAPALRCQFHPED